MAYGKKTGGRQRGTPNRATKERQRAVEESGITPLAVMLDNMRFAHERAGTLLDRLLEIPPDEAQEKFNEALRMRQIAQDCAKDAARYVHPMLANIEHTGKDGGPMQFTLQRILEEIDGQSRGLPQLSASADPKRLLQ